MIKNLKKYRLMANLTQKELADKIYKTREVIASYENRKAQPDIETLIAISKVLNITVDELVCDSQDERVIRLNKEELLKLEEALNILKSKYSSNRFVDNNTKQRIYKNRDYYTAKPQINIGTVADNHGIIGTNIGPVNSDKNSDSD